MLSFARESDIYDGFHESDMLINSLLPRSLHHTSYVREFRRGVHHLKTTSWHIRAFSNNSSILNSSTTGIHWYDDELRWLPRLNQNEVFMIT